MAFLEWLAIGVEGLVILYLVWRMRSLYTDEDMEDVVSDLEAQMQELTDNVNLYIIDRGEKLEQIMKKINSRFGRREEREESDDNKDFRFLGQKPKGI